MLFQRTYRVIACNLRPENFLSLVVILHAVYQAGPGGQVVGCDLAGLTQCVVCDSHLHVVLDDAFELAEPVVPVNRFYTFDAVFYAAFEPAFDDAFNRVFDFCLLDIGAIHRTAVQGCPMQGFPGPLL